MEQQDQEMLLLQKHFCKLCNKSFPCGRSLGGHMRSHLISNPSENGERSRNSSSGIIDGSVHTSYVLRENPRKTCKFAAESSGGGEDTLLQNQSDKVCKECGKGFQSWKALFGHMKCHSEKIMMVSTNNNNKSRNHVEEAADSWNVAVADSHSDDCSEAAKNNAPNRKKRSRRASATKRYQVVNATATTNSSTLTAANSASPCVSENIIVEHEHEEVAMSLIMLSRDVGSWGGFNSVTECSDNNSEFLGIRSSSQAQQESANTEIKAKKVLKADEKLKKPKSRGSGIPISGGNKVKSSEADRYKDCKLADRARFEKSEVDVPDNAQGSSDKKKRIDRDEENEFWFGSLNSEKKIKFECSTCNKSFHSYQALGGHRASHKKTKDGSINATDKNNEHYSAAPNHTAANSSCEQSIQELADNKVGSSRKIKVAHHECPICFKIFPSGQALGGHKRSHLIAEAKTSQQPITQMQKPSVPEIRDFLDLNLPAPVEEEEDKESHQSSGFQPWWMMGSSYNHEQLVQPTF